MSILGVDAGEQGNDFSEENLLSHFR